MITLLEDVANLAPVFNTARPRHDRVVLRHLMDTPGWSSMDDLVDVLWGHRADGGPLSCINEVSVVVWHIRKALKPGFSVESVHSRGYRFVVEQEALERLMLKSIAGALAA